MRFCGHINGNGMPGVVSKGRPGPFPPIPLRKPHAAQQSGRRPLGLASPLTMAQCRGPQPRAVVFRTSVPFLHQKTILAKQFVAASCIPKFGIAVTCLPFRALEKSRAACLLAVLLSNRCPAGPEANSNLPAATAASLAGMEGCESERGANRNGNGAGGSKMGWRGGCWWG